MRKCACVQVQHSTAAYAGRTRRWRHARRPAVHSVDDCGDSVIPSEVAEERGAQVEARLDRIPASPYLWKLIALLALGGFFEFYELFMTAFVSPGLIHDGIFQAGPNGLFHLPGQAEFSHRYRCSKADRRDCHRCATDYPRHLCIGDSSTPSPRTRICPRLCNHPNGRSYTRSAGLAPCATRSFAYSRVEVGHADRRGGFLRRLDIMPLPTGVATLACQTGQTGRCRTRDLRL